VTSSHLAVRLSALAAALALVGCQGQDTRPAKPHALEVTGLRVDGLVAPLGIDDTQPRFSWKSVSSRRNVTQRAYELKVVEGDGTQPTWSTGTRQDNRQLGIVYAGPALKPQTTYHWQVRVTDDQGTMSGWSEPGTFETGLGASTRWPAQWIGGTPGATSLPLLRRDFPLSATVTRARLYATARGAYTLSINGQAVSADRLAPG
jgi:alpha-L-rhamnosidase